MARKKAARTSPRPVTEPRRYGLVLVHNFSLIHDDIEDGDELRRGRPTLWKQWGVPQAINSGDTMFAMGCGRVNEGSMAEMWHSVNQFRPLPPVTHVYCGHEYTEANCRFALSVEPGNRDLQQRATVVAAQRARGEMTCPSTIGDELKTNPFMRCGSREIRKNLKLETATDAEVFAELRHQKNSFK